MYTKKTIFTPSWSDRRPRHRIFMVYPRRHPVARSAFDMCSSSDVPNRPKTLFPEHVWFSTRSQELNKIFSKNFKNLKPVPNHRQIDFLVAIALKVGNGVMKSTVIKILDSRFLKFRSGPGVTQVKPGFWHGTSQNLSNSEFCFFGGTVGQTPNLTNSDFVFWMGHGFPVGQICLQA